MIIDTKKNKKEYLVRKVGEIVRTKRNTKTQTTVVVVNILLHVDELHPDTPITCTLQGCALVIRPETLQCVSLCVCVRVCVSKVVRLVTFLDRTKLGATSMSGGVKSNYGLPNVHLRRTEPLVSLHSSQV